mmetsp:Transcript_28254/g.64247  ORF Transcript_28254/g.64247 Transcript_28254/m.64247 type:complete len:364 (+) Transcript_28254:93-1184(+)|eukprot:CAMPEP_0204337064 /NCGR_PEP_ID=MMETSP0469-20131031/20022_1 /ASSEMBLY_ACC=CAM_ASM_000384 /TAXON_ID=2969 /ORGANISM="Oxyrrhis marina" /LENGTH=363 /DNA_ID=CAMNT_0051321033 /DNA_START=93 /DNA_END=1184 /DNA_ORIENTATION=-
MSGGAPLEHGFSTQAVPNSGQEVVRECHPLPPDDWSRWTQNNQLNWDRHNVGDSWWYYLGATGPLRHVVMSLRTIPSIISAYHVLTCACGVLATYACYRFGIFGSMTWALVSFGIVFPLVFAITYGVNRRESALASFGQLRALLFAIWLAVRDWSDAGGDQARQDCYRMRAELYTLIDLVVAYLLSPNKYHIEKLDAIYFQFSRLSKLAGELMATMPRLASRVHQYISQALVALESCRHVKEYRTPFALRTMLYAALLSFPFGYAPYFAYLGKQQGTTLGLVGALAAAATTSAMLCSLLAVAEGLEDAYTGEGAVTDFISVRLPMNQLKAAMRMPDEKANRTLRDAEAKAYGTFEEEQKPASA